MFFIRYIPACFFAMTFAGCENDLSEVNKLITPETLQAEVAKEVEILYSDSAIVRVKINGPTMMRVSDERDPREEFPDGLAVEFYDNQGATNGWLTAKKGFRNVNKGTITVQDSVVWKSIKNEQLETEELVWDERSAKISTNKFVIIRRPDEIIYGYGFEANQDFSYSRIRAIQGRLKVDNLETKTEE